MSQPIETVNCPQCGNALPLQFRHTKLVVCSHCDSTLFLEDEAVKLMGERSVLPQAPSLLKLGEPFRYRNVDFLPVGVIRYRHKIGYWEEWWAMDNAGKGFWVSIDEGDFAFESPISLKAKPPQWTNLSIGSTLQINGEKWQVTEINTGICEGFSGELPEIIHVGEKVPFVHLSQSGGKLLTLEYMGNEVKAYKGQWVDPFDIKSNTA
jgi:ribosomal protein S27AE